MKRMLIICLSGLYLLQTACHVVRAVTYLVPDPGDKNHFPKALIPKSASPFYFLYSTMGISKNKKDFINKNLRHSNTDAFVVIQNDSIVYEYFSRKHNQNSIFLGFSLSKSFVATLLGIAIDEGYIKNTNEKIITYIPEFKKAELSLQHVTIQQLLDMRSGITIDETNIGLNGPLVRLYYGENIQEELFKLKTAKGNNFEYKNINTQLLSLIIERATRQKFLNYFRDKLWQKIGAEHDAEWIIDDHQHQTAKAFFGLIATAYDFAKLGRLYLREGTCQAESVVSLNWIHQCCDMDTLLKYNYKNHWWANNDEHYFTSDSLAKAYLSKANTTGVVKHISKNFYCVSQKGDSFIAEGMLDQYIYVNPSKNLMIVRLGKAVPESKTAMDKVITTLGNAF